MVVKFDFGLSFSNCVVKVKKQGKSITSSIEIIFYSIKLFGVNFLADICCWKLFCSINSVSEFIIWEDIEDINYYSLNCSLSSNSNIIPTISDYDKINWLLIYFSKLSTFKEFAGFK